MIDLYEDPANGTPPRRQDLCWDYLLFCERGERHRRLYYHGRKRLSSVVVSVACVIVIMLRQSDSYLRFLRTPSSSIAIPTTTAFAWTTMSIGIEALSTSSFVSSSKSVASSPRRKDLIRMARRSFTKSSTIVMMPEGPEVRTLVDQLQGSVGKRLVDIQFQSGRYLSKRPPGFVEFAKTMTPLWTPPHQFQHRNRSQDDNSVDVIREWKCKGKFLYIVLDQGHRDASSTTRNATNDTMASNECEDEISDDYQRSIWITLGMTGRFVNEAAHLHDPSFARWFLELIDPSDDDMSSMRTTKIHYHDQRNFGTLRFCLSKSELKQKLASLGLDILGSIEDEGGVVDNSSFTKEGFLNLLAQQKPTFNICKLLMDQSKLSGIGNYILSEALYRANVDPFASLQELNDTQRIFLFEQIQAVAQESYAAQGMTRYKGGAYRGVDGTQGKFEFELQCYSRDVCAKGRPVLRETNGPHKRTIWYVQDQLFMPREERVVEVLAGSDNGGADEDVGIVTPGANGIGFENLLDGLKERGWRNALEPYISTSESFGQLKQFLQEEQDSGATIYPSPENVFAALNLCPLDQTKVVILGQDPYHGPNQGMGLAFSVNRGIPVPPSLRNIFREAVDDVGIEAPVHGSLESWAKQGVLLLNTVLTVRRGTANSHAKRGWEEFTDEIIRTLNDRVEHKLVFLLWGRPAAQKAGKVVDVDKHVVISTSHPSPLGATKTAAPFLTSRCFSRANEALRSMGENPIDWNVPL